MIFYGDEVGRTNDYSYLDDLGKSYDNRWMHRPVIDWKQNNRIHEEGSVEGRVYGATQRLIAIRSKLPMIADAKNLTWLTTHNIHIAGYLRTLEDRRVYCLFNFTARQQALTWFALKEHGAISQLSRTISVFNPRAAVFGLIGSKLCGGCIISARIAVLLRRRGHRRSG
jgi:amylosucrase